MQYAEFCKAYIDAAEVAKAREKAMKKQQRT